MEICKMQPGRDLYLCQAFACNKAPLPSTDEAASESLCNLHSPFHFQFFAGSFVPPSFPSFTNFAPQITPMPPPAKALPWPPPPRPPPPNSVVAVPWTLATS